MANESYFQSFVEQIPNGVLITDAAGDIEYVNPAFEEITGYSAEEALGKNPSFMQSGRQDEAFYQTMWQILSDTGSWQGEVWNRHKSGHLYAEWLSISAQYDEAGKVLRYFGLFADISSLAKASEGLQRLAYRDALTALPNRVLFRDRIEQSIRIANRCMSGFALLFVDLDGFKRVNDTHGHAAGDEVLMQVARVLRSSVRESDTVARLGGDEFAALLDGLQNDRDLERICQRIVAGVQKLGLEGAPVGASIGIAFYPGDGVSEASLMQIADSNMYVAKAAGGNQWHSSSE